MLHSKYQGPSYRGGVVESKLLTTHDGQRTTHDARKKTAIAHPEAMAQVS